MSNRRRRQVITGRISLSHGPDVVDWTRGQIVAGRNRDQIVADSKAGRNGWPVPGRALSNGGFTEVRAAIAAIEHMEGNGATPPAKRVPSRSRRRLNELAPQRSEAVLIDSAFRIARYPRELEAIDIAIELDDDGVTAEVFKDVVDDVLHLEYWVQRTIAAVLSRLDDAATIAKILALRRTNGCPPAEAEARHAAADRLQAGLNRRLNPG